MELLLSNLVRCTAPLLPPIPKTCFHTIQISVNLA
jgi:hypothetical protein